MSLEAGKEITRLWKALHAAQSEIGKSYFRWRAFAVDCFGDDSITSLEISLKAAEFFGRDIGKSFLPRLNWLKGEKGFLLGLAKLLSNLWVVDGGLAIVEKSDKDGEVFIKCTRDPWPTWAKEYNVPMEEVVLIRKRLMESILNDVGLFFNISMGVEILKSIPKGEGQWLVRVYKK